VPIFTVIAGPNGAGKSSLTQTIDLESRQRLLDPDAVARCLNSVNPAAAAILAARDVLKRTQDYLEQKVSFAIETTLSGGGRLALIREAKTLGYEVHLMFIGLDSAERCITRVRSRAARGGHSVPEADVRRRYARSVENAHQALSLADVAKFYDNSSDCPRLVLLAKGGRIVWKADPLPAWLRL